MTSIKPRKSPPTNKTTYDDPLRYRVWAQDQTYLEDVTPWKCVAMFSYLQEALDYIAYCQDMGAPCVFQSPADVRAYSPSDARAVFKAPAA